MAFTAQTTYSTGSGSGPVSLSMTDVNSDTKPDIIVALYDQYTVGVLFNFGNGTFHAQTTYSTGIMSYPQRVAGVDVNGDSKPDIIVANNNGNNVGVLFNAGNGTFLSQTTYPTGSSSYPPSASAADVNNDNKSDIVVANQNLGNVGVLFNFGNGTFRSQTTYSTGNNAGPTSVVLVDVNADGQRDIIIANYNEGSVGVLLNFGNGTFRPVTSYLTGNNSKARSVSIVDVNNDNKPDIIVANYGINNIGVLFNFGNGTFGPQTTYSTGNNSGPISVAAVDINGDNKPDIIVANYNANNVGVLYNAGDGTFLPQTTCSSGTTSHPQSVSVTDINNDSKPDIIVANYGADNIGVLLAN
ncbi:unnamed protein product [Adineta steineri]|uniref:VCBS repeat-containing protein n=1 Tax=Adineta steineri TaxID=433720 RepID=A0A819PR02_9BILA|nr:unnamed protein product [Adineta steineri]CAF1400392.1 unnamed protein product [Adineta steineri]CAF3873598.1 unnamed protein product [Adineta steineri]CAF4018229.1 unnamed protein product [Adineta steineri]